MRETLALTPRDREDVAKKTPRDRQENRFYCPQLDSWRIRAVGVSSGDEITSLEQDSWRRRGKHGSG
jgi:hypothetical protein